MGHKLNHAQMSIAIICVIVGFAVALQMKSVIKIRSTATVESVRMDELRAELLNEREKGGALYRQVIELKNDLQEFQKQAAQNSDYSKILAKRLEYAEMMAGVSAVEGPGIVIKMDDSKSKNSALGVNSGIIHDGDLLMVINELRDAGAEAFSLNGERLLATSELRCAGSVVSVNNNRYTVPFEIKAIGDPDKLERALYLKDGVVDNLKFYDIQYEIKKMNKLTVESYKGAITFNYAIAVPETPKEGE